MARLARIIRWSLALAVIGLIAWAFFDVTARAISRYRSDTARRVKLTMLHWGSPAESQIVQTLIDQYMKEHPDVFIERINASDFQAKLKTMMAGGTTPDIFYLPPDLLPELASLELIRPIDDYIKKVPDHEKWMSDFYPVVLDTFRYDVQTERVGKGPLYGLPKDFTTTVFYVNVDLFERAGVRIPYDGWTWDEFEADMKKIRALDTGKPNDPRIYGGTFQIWPDTLLEIVWTFGGDFFGPGGFRDVTLDEP
ncbi:MAG TPA: extracellular solute-binding protein, partial [Tepidisphaeraceae bacterium]|nr:extracellular solute-binding protein [Tepidisphaeraceae bacterium]